VTKIGGHSDGARADGISRVPASGPHTETSVPAESYHADTFHDGPPALSAGIAHTLLTRSPAHAWERHPRLNPDWKPRDDDKFDLGRVAHQVLLEGNANIVVVEADDWRTKAAKETRLEARASGMTAMLAADWQRVLDMTGAVAQKLLTLDVEPRPFFHGLPEQTFIWYEGDVVCKCRVDWLHEGNVAISDLKTTGRSAQPEQWARSILWSIGCDIQVAWYTRGVQAVTGVRPRFRYVVVEVEPPYGLSIVELGEEAIAVGEAKVNRALEVWADCLEHDRWPGYTSDVYVAQPPPWEARWITDEVEEVAWAQM